MEPCVAHMHVLCKGGNVEANSYGVIMQKNNGEENPTLTMQRQTQPMSRTVTQKLFNCYLLSVHNHNMQTLGWKTTDVSNFMLALT